MKETFTFDSRTRNALFVHVINMIFMAGKVVIAVVLLTSVVFKVSGNFSYFSLFFPKQDLLLSVLYFVISIILFSIILGIIFSFFGTKKEILSSYDKKDNWIWVKLF